MSTSVFNYVTQTMQDMDILLILKTEKQNYPLMLMKNSVNFFFVFKVFLSYDLQGIGESSFITSKRKIAGNGHRNLQRLSQGLLGVFWKCPLIKAIIRAL